MGNIAIAQVTIVSNPSACGLDIAITDNNCTSDGTIYQPEEVEIIENNNPGILGVDVYLSEVRIILEHTWANDLNITLLSPSGVSVELTANNGGGDDNFGDPADTLCNSYSTFAVAACTPVEEGLPPFLEEPYQPHDHFYTLNDGITSANGSWLLLLCDDAPGDIGSLEFVELVFEPMNCLPITEVNVVTVEANTVELEWEPSSFCGTAILNYGPPGFVPGTDSTTLEGAVQIFDCSPVTLTGLQPDTEYELYIRRYCEETEHFSLNSCSVLFTTGCEPPSLTYLEDFDSHATCVGNCLVDCDLSGIWQNARNDDMDWSVNSGITITPGTGPSDDESGGGKYIYIETSGCTSDMEAVLYSPCVELDKQGTDTCHLSFSYHMFGFTVGSLSLEVSQNGGFDWDLLWQKSGNQGDEWKKVFIGLGDYEDGSILQFRFIGEKTSGLKGDIALDEIAIHGSAIIGMAEIIYYFDGDNDGYGDDGNYVLSCTVNPPSNYVILPGDCNDADEFINPGAEEIPCDGIDNNCNIAEVDDDVILPPPPATGDVICSGEIPLLCATPVEGNYILWYDAVRQDSVVGFGDCFSPTDLPLNNSPVPIEFTYLVGQSLDFLCFTEDLAEVVVIINPLPKVSTTDMPEICPAESFNLASLNIFDDNFTGGQLTFHTALPANPGNIINPPVVSPSETTDYYFLMTSPDGCTDDGVVTLKVKPGPDLTFSPSDSFSLCRESFETITVEPIGGTGDYEFFWSTGNSDSSFEVEADYVAGTEDIYFVTVTDEEGCFSTDSVIVTTTNSIDSVKVFVTDVSECMGTNGGIRIIPLNGSAPFSLNWTGTNGDSGSLVGVQDTAFITDIAQGGYHIEITDSSQEVCTFNLRNIIVQGPGVIIMEPIIADVSCFGAGDGEICLDLQGSGGIQYLWSTGDTTLCVNGLNGGEYTVTITSGECETVLNEIQVEEPDSLFVISESTSPTCHDLSDGSIILNTFGGTTPYEYFWSTTDVSPYILNKTSGNYLVIVTDFNDCTLTETIALTAPDPLSVNLDSLQNMSCNGNMDGYLQVSGTGGIPPYQYLWNTGSTSSVLVNLQAGSYQVTITDLNDCETTASFEITNPDYLEIQVSQLIQPQCLGDTTGLIELSGVGGTLPYTFFGPQGALFANTLENVGVGTYELYVVDFYGCQSDKLTVELTSVATLDFMASLSPPACKGPSTGSIQLQPDGIGPFAYNWVELGDTTALVDILPTGAYSVQVMDGEGCIYDTTYVLNAPQVFNLDFAVSAPSCYGVDDGIIDVLILNSGTPPFDLIWNDGNTETDRTDLMPGDYQLSVMDANGCTFISDTMSIGYPELLDLEVEEIGIPICFGDSTAYIETNVLGGTQPYMINWLGTGLVTEDISDLPADEYRIIVFDAHGCAIDTTFNLEQPAMLVPEVDILQGEMCAPAVSDTLLASATGGVAPYVFSWSEGSQGALLTGVNPGNYSLTVVDANNCTAILEDVKLGEKTGAIQLDTFIVNGISCAGASDANMTAVISSGSGAYLYHFTPTYIIQTSEESITKNDVIHSASYSVTVTDINSGCTVVSEEVEAVAPLPLTVTQDSTQAVICFGGGDGAIYIDVAGGTPEFDFAWYNEANALVGTDEDLMEVSAGIYTISVTDDHGCTATMTDSSVINLSTLLVNDSTIITDVKCRGDSTGIIDIAVSGGEAPYAYEWSYGGIIDEDLTEAPFGVYTVTVTDADTCRVIFPFFNIGQPTTFIELAEEEIEYPSCFDAMDGSIAVGLMGGSPPYTMYWNYDNALLPGAVFDSIENLTAGLYELVLTDTIGCEERFEFELPAPDSLELNIIGTPPMPPDTPGMLAANATGGTPEYIYLWSTGDTEMSIEVTEESTYSVTVTDANDCEVIDSILLVPVFGISEVVKKVRVFPNPVNNLLFVELDLKSSGSVKLEVLDLFGRVVKEIKKENFLSGRLELQLDNLPEGLYHLKCSVDGYLERVVEVVVVKS
jgi:hypothetical protein